MNKKLLINKLKIDLEYLIKTSLDELPFNINQIKVISDDHYQFINFINSMNIYEYYKWDNIKKDYNIIKKKVNHDKKFYIQIIKIYGTINNYYSIDEFNNYNNIIKKINDFNNIIVIDWNNIKKLHKNLTNKRKNYIKNINIIKIIKINKDCIILIKKLYEIYDKLKNIKKELISNTIYLKNI